MKGTAKVRMLAACFGLAVFFTIFSYRLIYLQVLKHDEYTALAAEKHVKKTVIYSDRAVITDVYGEVLAANKPIETAVANGTLITNPELLADLLAKPLEMDRAKLAEMLRSDRPYIVLKKKIPESVANALESKMTGKALRGVWFEHDSARTYPNGMMLCHVLGFIDGTHHGVAGIEKSMDSYLSGHDGFRYTERDRTGKEVEFYRGQERPAMAGCSVKLTIDMGLQNIVENELDAAMKQFRPKSAIVILMKPQTGEILALANRPNFDLNAVGDYTHEDMINRAIEDMVEPGSTFKIVTVSAAMNERAVREDTMIFCENGHFNFAGKVLKDHHGYGDIPVADVIMKSSNIGAAKIAMMLGEQKFYEYIRRFGFGERTGISLPGEISGLVHPPYQWSKISISRIPMGQGVGVTPIQTVAAMAAVANGGHLMMPQIVHEIVDDKGSTVMNYSPVEVRQVMSAEVAGKMRDMLVRVVSKEGTAVLASVTGFTVAGKTGTAQIPIPGGVGYYDNKYVASFEGFMPAENPAFVALVMINDPKTGPEQYYGGLVAAPVFSRIAEKAARYLGLVPHIDENTKNKIIITNARD